MGDSWLVDKEKFLPVIRCPVCLTIPRDVPIPQCEAGHIICIPCSYKANMNKCPTCRRDINKKITSSLAASLVELVPHECKFSKFGCEVQDLLSSLVNHEKVCDRRTIRCFLGGFKCPLVPLKDYDQHVIENKCFPLSDPNGVMRVVYKGVLDSGSGGASKFKMEDLKFEHYTFYLFNFFGKNFYLMECYFGHPYNKFYYCVMMAAMKEEETEAFSSKLTVSSKDGKFKMDFTLPVLLIEEAFPLVCNNINKMLDDRKLFDFPLIMMKQILDYEKIDEGDQKVERVFYTLKLDVKKKQTSDQVGPWIESLIISSMDDYIK